MSAVALALAVVVAHPAYAGIPHVAIVTYPVHGDTLAAIRASLDTRHPVDRNDGQEVEAVTHWRFTWQWPGPHDDQPCDLTAASVRFAATVTLPRLVGLSRLPAEVQAAWR
uniref:DUF922 domain-containing protein n=1 Tax=Sphingomonas bacterium TaxID=1895847 RepID=UPI001576E87A